ncbi:hypothetical protein TNIN_411301 [Trichonephila inaurata madagascariensis]|uniref:Uncharacterized protein n=1 Tax=Trichonephila inaurata madagascariensis TaxID=2747483 RepID=A0A8X6WSA1_9ARAC|nr:hypothetical protein TNIN_411301 [Trichonephila inaurata madagascariensis]
MGITSSKRLPNLRNTNKNSNFYNASRNDRTKAWITVVMAMKDRVMPQLQRFPFADGMQMDLILDEWLLKASLFSSSSLNLA